MKKLLCLILGHKPAGQITDATSTVPLAGPMQMGTACRRCGTPMVMEREARLVTRPTLWLLGAKAVDDHADSLRKLGDS